MNDLPKSRRRLTAMRARLEGAEAVGCAVEAEFGEGSDAEAAAGVITK